MQGTEQGETDNMEIIFNDWKICHQEKTFNEFNWTKKNSIVLYFSSGEMLGLYFEFTKQISESIIKHKLPCPPPRRVNADEFVRNGRSYGTAMFEIYSNASGRRKEDVEGNVGFCIWKLILPFKFPFPFSLQICKWSANLFSHFTIAAGPQHNVHYYTHAIFFSFLFQLFTIFTHFFRTIFTYKYVKK